MRRRSEVAAEGTGSAGAAAEGTRFVQCAACGMKQARGGPECIGCGKSVVATEAKAAPAEEDDPWGLLPKSVVEAKPAATPTPPKPDLGPIVMSLKKLGYDVTLAVAEAWTPKYVEGALKFVRGEFGDRVPQFLAQHHVGEGKVAGARPSRAEQEEGPHKAEPIKEDEAAQLKATAKQVGLPLVEMSISEMVQRLETYRIAISVEQAAQLTTTQRKEVKEFLEEEAKSGLEWTRCTTHSVPHFLEKFFKPDPKPAEGAKERKHPELPGEVGVTLTYTWGEEKFTPVPNSFSTCTVGPFTATTTVGPGESYMGAYHRLQDFVKGFADAERKQKIDKFVAKLREVLTAAKDKG